MPEEQSNKKEKTNWSSAKIMSLSAVFVSFVSLAALFYQLSLAREENELIRKQQSASVLPHLRLSPSLAPESFKYVFINKGVGPAFIKEVEFTLPDTTFQRSDFFVDYISAKIRESDGFSISRSTYSFMEGDVLSANDELVIFTINGKAGIALFRNYLRSVPWNYKVIYEDVYGARWKLDLDSPFPSSIPLK